MARFENVAEARSALEAARSARREARLHAAEAAACGDKAAQAAAERDMAEHHSVFESAREFINSRDPLRWLFEGLPEE